ncbi:Nucleolar protein 58 [Nymphon striatum]|nr:Nucleolar protein 58 [Nymphon striatum]
MLVLFENSGGYAMFKDFSTSPPLIGMYDLIMRLVDMKTGKLFEFVELSGTLFPTAGLVEGKIGKKLKKMLKKLVAKDINEELAVADAKLGSIIKEKYGLTCVHNNSILELMRCIRSQAESLLADSCDQNLTQMSLGLAHGYKLKFSPDKIDTMVIQAVCLLDDLDKELNNYIMRAREWYGWHFPEIGKVITDNSTYIEVIKFVGMRTNFKSADLSELLTEELEKSCKELAEISMGVEVSDEDMVNIVELCDEIIEMSNYRNDLHEYLKNRMMSIAPNLSVLVGELVGARLISHAGSLINLAKHPASTVQILGAEKALFRSLKTKHNTPKYGLIYHAQLVGQSSAALKGKIARMLAAKSALACRVDALGDDQDGKANAELGIEHRAKLESRLKFLQEGGMRRISGTGKQKAKFDKYENKSIMCKLNIASVFCAEVYAKPRVRTGHGISGISWKKRLPIPGMEYHGIKQNKPESWKIMEFSTAPEVKKIKQALDDSVDLDSTTLSEKKKKKKKSKERKSLRKQKEKEETTELDQSNLTSSKKKKKKRKSKDKSSK